MPFRNFNGVASRRGKSLLSGLIPRAEDAADQRRNPKKEQDPPKQKNKLASYQQSHNLPEGLQFAVSPPQHLLMPSAPVEVTLSEAPSEPEEAEAMPLNPSKEVSSPFGVNSFMRSGLMGSLATPPPLSSEVLVKDLISRLDANSSDEEYVNALTAIITGEGGFTSSDEEDKADALHSLDLSEIDSAEEMSIASAGADSVYSTRSLAIGQVIDLWDGSTTVATTSVSSMGPGTPSSPRSDSTASPVNVSPGPRALLREVQRSGNLVNGDYKQVKEMLENQAKDADREEIAEIGESLYTLGEMLLKNGRPHEALEVFERAEVFQRRSLSELMRRISDTMHSQGLKHCDRGDRFLSVILLGVAETLKHRPNASHVNLCRQVHIGYKSNAKKVPDLRNLVDDVDEYIKLAGKEAVPLAKNLKAQVACLQNSRSKHKLS
jgi:hypothetical protein